MLRPPAWCVLSLSARRILDRIEIELADHGGMDHGKLPVTFDNFARYGIHRHAIAPAIREAVALGFVEITQAGRAGNADWRKPNLFRLTYRETRQGAPTHDWEKITTEDAAILARAARSAKTEHQCRKTPNPSAGKPAPKRKSPVLDTITTGHSAETITTLDISGRHAKPNGRLQ